MTVGIMTLSSEFQQNGIRLNDTQQNESRHNGTQYSSDFQQNDIRLKDAHQNILGLMTLISDF
jgi:hypothetical protein